jgi:hypothetical protein
MSSRTITRPAPGERQRPTYRRHALVVSPIVVALLLVAVGGYVLHWAWTGYLTPPPGKAPRTLWDWLTLALQPLVLLSIPVVLELVDRRRVRWRLPVAAGALVLAVLIIGGYRLGWTWTGFSGNTLWDWLGLFLVPFALPLVFVFLAAERRSAEARATAEARLTLPQAGATDRPSPTFGMWAVVGLAVAALVLGSFAAGWAAHAPARPGPAWTQVAAVTVSASDRDWTDTHVRVRRGERLQVLSVGMVQPGPGQAAVGPGGDARDQRTSDSLVAGLPHLSLLATVTPSRAPLPIDGHGGRIVGVGQQRTLVAPATGELLLAVNDRGFGNDSGWFGATIRAAATRP